MNRSIKEAFTKTVVHYFTDICNFNKKATVEYFLKGGHPKSTLYKIIKRFETTGCSDYKHLNLSPKKSLRKNFLSGRPSMNMGMCPNLI
jgi:hypothetical protein